MSKPIGNILQSTTTQNVVLGVLAGTLTADGLVAFIHTLVEAYGGTLGLGWDATIFYLASAVAIPVISRLVAYARAWTKNWIGMLSVLFCASLALSGCVTMAPALNTKTKVSTEYSDDSLGNVVYKQTFVGGAGDLASGATHAKRKWDGEKGDFEVGVNGSIDTSAQAAALTALGGQQFDFGTNALGSVLSLAQIVAPLVSQNMQYKQELDLYEAANPTESTQDKLLALIGQRLNDPSAGTAFRDLLTQLLSPAASPTTP